MTRSYARKLLSSHFHRLGGSIGKHPVIYLCLSLSLALFQSFGLLKFWHVTDLEELFLTSTGRSLKDMNFIEKTFPSNISEPIDMERLTRMNNVAIIIITAKDGGRVFSKEVAKEVFSLYDEIYDVSVQWQGKDWNFSSVCSPWWFGHCILDSASEIFKRLNEFNSGKFRPFYPIDWSSYEAKTGPTVTAMNFGGVETNEEKRIVSAKAIRFLFMLERRSEQMSQISQLWEEKFSDVMEKKSYEYIDVCTVTFSIIARELTYTTLQGLPFGALTTAVIVLFAVLTLLTSDPVASKPFLGVAAGASALLGLVSSFGVLFLLGVPYIDISLSVPFLILGVGVDDSFMLIASWRKTSPQESVPQRMAAAYSEAAMSVTITSFTNFIAFLFGMATPFRQIRIYSSFLATSVFFCYAYQIVFFGACMALSGYREEKRLHCLTFRKVPVRDDKGRSMVTSYAEDCEIPGEKDDLHSTAMMRFFRDSFSDLLINRYFRIVLILLFVVYMTMAGIGCTMVVDGPDYRNAFRYGSAGWKYMDYSYRYFGDYPHRLQVVIDEELDYSDPRVQAKVEQLTMKFETAAFAGEPEMTVHWLRSYKDFLNSTDFGTRIILRGYNATNPRDFYDVLRNIFFKIPVFKKFSSDVVFTSNYTNVAQSRFIIQTKGAYSSVIEKEMLEEIYRVADACEYKTVAFHSIFRLVEQSVFVKDVTIQTISCTAAAMILVFLIFIPNLRYILLVALCLTSIEVGVVGFMAIWNVNLDPVALLCLIMTIGFSVDFASHVSYSFSSSGKMTAEERIRYSMYSAGMPVLQGAGSTILGVVFLTLTSSYSFMIIFKIMFLSMLLGCLHSLVLLPVLLSLVVPHKESSTSSHQPVSSELKVAMLNRKGRN